MEIMHFVFRPKRISVMTEYELVPSSDEAQPATMQTVAVASSLIARSSERKGKAMLKYFSFGAVYLAGWIVHSLRGAIHVPERRHGW
eukprot:scaffold209298_cov35-Prasinocladus_malaysianus.AAC.1